MRRFAISTAILMGMACGSEVRIEGAQFGSDTSSSSSSSSGSVGSGGGDLGLGQPCASSEPCASGYCVDGVCCDGACGGLCEACSGIKTGAADGACSPIPFGVDPDAECAGDLTCDGAGECVLACGGLECTDLGFECGSCAVDASGCGTADQPWAGWDDIPAPAPGDLEVVAASIDELTGASSDNGGASPEGKIMVVGSQEIQEGDLMHSVGGLTFDLSILPAGADVVSATAYVYQVDAYFNVYVDPMTKLVASHARFDTLWDAIWEPPILAAFTERDVSLDDSEGWKAFDVTDAVRYDLATCRDRSQFTLEFAPENGVSGAVDHLAHFAASDGQPENKGAAPYLAVRYR